MTTVHIPFLQTGTLAVGGRLLEDEERSVQSQADRPSSLTKGHRACQGCAEALAARWVMDTAVEAADDKLIVANATGCLEVFSTLYPESAWKPPWIHSVFANAAAVATGIAASLHAQGRDDIRVLAQGGDGGTVDIGLAAVSGMFERNDDVLYVCYDNQGYMNTGVQRSSATPTSARTATTPAVGCQPGAPVGQGKSMPKIAMAHEIPYVATATVADLRDLEHKVRTAMSIHGARYLHVLVPCPLGWGASSAESIRLSRAAVQSGIFPVIESRAGELTDVQPIRQRMDVEEYLRPQARFAHLFKPGGEDALDRWRAMAERNIRHYDLLGERS
ncbi:thiamine pyrophosphate-dependent enzyme [Demequina zhanjiangensis]|uniref:Thiamine pyrophosphate-dependent enzyme n=1 Tax=Demequina zhanjiangensis TaxID=3051659 RepID=A0ABT8G268_9MICO|nr:thiamine pyrophosphate-dependent enzyme [Demequina sp. SYSU T00b26]MDN4473236.1 thiamine pyrophosphate-dependent enzyme [Demequina sp. SYSU T00b26]